MQYSIDQSTYEYLKSINQTMKHSVAGSDISVWMRNVQLALLSVPLGLITAYAKVDNDMRKWLLPM